MICPACNEAHVRGVPDTDEPKGWTCDHCGSGGYASELDNPCPSTSPSGHPCERVAGHDEGDPPHGHLVLVNDEYIWWFV